MEPEGKRSLATVVYETVTDVRSVPFMIGYITVAGAPTRPVSTIADVDPFLDGRLVTPRVGSSWVLRGSNKILPVPVLGVMTCSIRIRASEQELSPILFDLISTGVQDASTTDTYKN